MSALNILLLDHFDSFTWNLYQYLGELGQPPTVLRTNTPFEEVRQLQPSHLILSPGPGHPQEVELFSQALSHWQGRIPILGVCLGHQAIALHHGAVVKRNYRLMHGKTSLINHDADGLLAGLPQPLTVCRYHSLVVDPQTCQDNGLKITAQTPEGEVMAITSCRHPNMFGVQFHPESIYTPEGMTILERFLNL